MAELQPSRIALPGTPLGAPNPQRPPSQPQSRNTTGRNTPVGGGSNADDAIVIGSSDDEGEDVRPFIPRRRAPGNSIEEQRARVYVNRRGTPVPRAPENGLRIMSPPPPLPAPHHPPMPEQPAPAPLRFQDVGLHEIIPRLLHQLTRSDRAQLQRIFEPGQGPEVTLDSLLDLIRNPQAERPGPPAPEYDVRMTHAGAKPRIGYTFDFGPDEEELAAAAAVAAAAAAAEQAKHVTPPLSIRTRTTIIIPDSPPARPMDHKGKGRAREEDVEQDGLDLDGPIDLVSSPAGSSSSYRPRKRPRLDRAVEIVELFSDDETDDEGQRASGSRASASVVSAPSSSQVVQLEPEAEPENIQTILVCGGCRRPLRTGGDRLWALRCGHMIDSHCYRRYAEGREELAASSSSAFEASHSTHAPKRRRTSRNSKGKGPVPASVPQVIETLEWRCPVTQCGRVHKTEHVVTGGGSMWQPAKEDGAIKVFV